MNKGIERCRACNSTNVEMFFDLGLQPFANALLHNEKDYEGKYPLSLSFCSDCSLVQLDFTANPAELFSNYFWVTSTSKTAREYASVFCKKALQNALSSDIKYVLEIASNDGTFLRPFCEDNIEVIGVDPAENIAKMANESGVPTINAFFGEDVAKKIINDRGYPSITFARNVLPHVANLHDFVSGLSYCIDDQGILILEVHYAGKILEELHYDSIYHEHLCYFTLQSVENLLNLHGLYIFDIETSPISGGSVVLYISKDQGKKKSEKLAAFEMLEQKQKYNTFTKWQEFANKSLLHRDLLNKMIDDALEKGIRLVGYGASARSSTMLNFCGIDKHKLLKIADQNQLKRGFYTPGSRIEIITPEEAFTLKPEGVVLLAWNFKDEIIDLLKNKYGFRGDIITPLPFPPVKETL